MLKLLLGRCQAPLRQMNVDRQSHTLRMLGNSPADGLHDPPGGVAREPKSFAIVELFDSADQAAIALRDQVLKREPAALKVARDLDYETKVRLDHLAPTFTTLPNSASEPSS